MSLSEAALKKLTKDEVIELTLESQANLYNSLSDISKELIELRNNFKKI